MKKMLALLVCAALALALLPASALADDPVAQIGSKTYTTLQAAVDDVPENGANTTEITLLKDVTLTDTLTVTGGRNVTLNLNGHTISRTDSVIFVQNGTLIVSGTGCIQETADDGYGAINIKGSNNVADLNYTTVVVGPMVTLRGWTGLFIRQFDTDAPFDPAEYVAYGVNVTLEGTIYSPAQDNHTTAGHGIYINGNIQHTTNYPVISIASSASVNARLGTGIYAAGYAEWNIASGAYIAGRDSGIAIKSGKLNMTGGMVRCTGPNSAPTAGYSNGVNESGAALQIESNKDYVGDININVTGGSLVSDNGYAVYEYLDTNTNTTATQVTEMNIHNAALTSKLSVLCLSQELITADDRDEELVVVDNNVISVGSDEALTASIAAVKEVSPAAKDNIFRIIERADVDDGHNPPTIVAPTKDTEVELEAGESGALSVSALDATGFQWQMRVPGGNWQDIPRATGATLTVSGDAEDGTEYRCFASNSYGNVASKTFTVRVAEAATVVEPTVEPPQTGDGHTVAGYAMIALLALVTAAAIYRKKRA